MQITVKAAPGRERDASDVVRRVVASSLPDLSVDVRPLFPEATKGHRGRLFVVDLPADLSPNDVEKLVEALKSDKAIEYASVPSPKSPY